MEHHTEEKNTNSLFLIITIIVIIALAIFWFTKLNKNSVTNQIVAPVSIEDIDRSEVLSSEDICYVSMQNRAEGLRDLYSLNLSIASDGSARGNLITSPAEKDTMQGKLFGIISKSSDGRIFEGWYDNQAEGVENTDQISIKVLEDKAIIGYGEMVQAGDAYVYKDAKNINYNLEIPAIPCALQEEIISM